KDNKTSFKRVPFSSAKQSVQEPEFEGELFNQGTDEKKASLVLKKGDQEIDGVDQWYNGNIDSKMTMQRQSPAVKGNVKENWCLSGKLYSEAKNKNYGTPGKHNSCAVQN
ncbi:hypothetical protein THIOM_001694, partial [Candidatus Thiomargarita nelsonii]